ncbi:hypothetical protein B0T17DRAFT_530651 [Bombardia bombarda]|uniref:Uncharacterized protein n=1 Tax=Bombardia bombarda TaxID=252184 RepID=A0AA40C4N6_9PEZI|nr:hypothetical protein B0T17DRAFT_530651 [Bombardia bombarda]
MQKSTERQIPSQANSRPDEPKVGRMNEPSPVMLSGSPTTHGHGSPQTHQPTTAYRTPPSLPSVSHPPAALGYFLCNHHHHTAPDRGAYPLGLCKLG